MANRIMEVLRRLPSRTRKVLLVTALVIGTVLFLKTTVFSGGPFNVTPDGIMPPDMKFTQKMPNGDLITYSAQQRRAPQRGEHAASTVILRNGKTWLTITYKEGAFLISDPNGTGEAVIRASDSPKPKTEIMTKPGGEKGR